MKTLILGILMISMIGCNSVAIPNTPIPTINAPLCTEGGFGSKMFSNHRRADHADDWAKKHPEVTVISIDDDGRDLLLIKYCIQ